MEFNKIAERVKGLKWISPAQGRLLYDHVIDNKVQNILELGFYHGVSTMYMAAALHENDSNGLITTIDKESSRLLMPNIETLANEADLQRFVRPLYADNCYTWELMRLLEQKPRPSYDLIFIDGAHLWKTDGFAFFLCDKMLAENGVIIFDDLKWSIAANADRNNLQWTLKHSEEQKKVAHIRKVFDLLVKEHPLYGDFKEEDGFGFARKLKAGETNLPRQSTVVKTVIVTREMLSALRK